MNLPDLTALAEEETGKILAALPAELRAHLKAVPVFFEGRPGPDDPLPFDTLGVYEEGAPIPHIRLWLENLWDYAEGNVKTFRAEVRVTLLHEIGHVLGWDEEDVRLRGLE